MNDDIIKDKGKWHNKLTKNIGFGVFNNYTAFGQADRFTIFLLGSDIRKFLNEKY